MSSQLTQNHWQTLRRFTSVRIAQGRAGNAIPTNANLKFQLDHARARDAVHQPLDSDALLKELEQRQQLKQLGLEVNSVQSQAKDRMMYLQRPDFGRKLAPPDADKLKKTSKPADIAIIVADGLSSIAVHQHAGNLLAELLPAIDKADHSLAPLTIVKQGRVAIGDEIGQTLRAKLSLILIGERPGLSSPDSLGIYLTYNPKPGTMDSQRNCISNIRPPEGLSYQAATATCLYLINNALERKLSGVNLKDDSITLEQTTADAIPFFNK